MGAIFGIIPLKYSLRDFDRSNFPKTGTILQRGGPGHFGFHEEDNVFMASCGLSSVDVQNDNQPFYSKNSHICAVHNGKIYNYQEIREDLKEKGYHFETCSDTEVILKAYMEYGKDCVQRFNGMFGFAIYDKKQKRVLLYRDRYGVKPLFLYRDERSFCFASEIKAFWSMGLEKVFDLSHLSLFLKFGYLPYPFTLFKNVSQLKPGHFLEIAIASGEIQEKRWWDWKYNEKKSRQETELIDEFYELFSDSIRIRTSSDVPCGAFLSGGVDSSMIVGQMSSLGIKDINTYSISFTGTKFDETRYARQVANLFKARNKTKNFNQNSLGLWERVLFNTDQPHADVSFLPKYQLSKLAAEDVEVVLTGDGGDAVFAGEPIYAEVYDKQQCGTGDIVNLFLKINAVFSNKFISQTSCDANIDLPTELLYQHVESVKHWEPLDRILYLDFQTLLVGNTLVKPDRMGIAHHIESRIPFMDYRVVDFGFNLPCCMKTTKKKTRAFQKNSALRLLPSEIIDRPKGMFTVPITEWEEGSLFSMAESIIQKSTREILGSPNVENLLSAHRKNPKETLRAVRALIAFQIWHAQHFEPGELDRIRTYFNARANDCT